MFDTDERPMDTSLEKMAKLGTAFKKNGTVTAGNASGLNDAAAAVVLMSREKSKELGIKPLGKIVSWRGRRRRSRIHGTRPGSCGKKSLEKGSP